MDCLHISILLLNPLLSTLIFLLELLADLRSLLCNRILTRQVDVILLKTSIRGRLLVSLCIDTAKNQVLAITLHLIDALLVSHRLHCSSCCCTSQVAVRDLTLTFHHERGSDVLRLECGNPLLISAQLTRLCTPCPPDNVSIGEQHRVGTASTRLFTDLGERRPVLVLMCDQI